MKTRRKEITFAVIVVFLTVILYDFNFVPGGLLWPLVLLIVLIVGLLVNFYINKEG